MDNGDEVRYGKARRERILQYLKMLTYLMSVVLMGVFIFMAVTQAQMMKRVSQMMSDVAEQVDDSASDYSSDYSSDE